MAYSKSKKSKQVISSTVDTTLTIAQLPSQSHTLPSSDTVGVRFLKKFHLGNGEVHNIDSVSVFDRDTANYFVKSGIGVIE